MRRLQWILLNSACGAALLASPAVAQDSSAQSQPTASRDADIIVTARRQNERLQDVPASVAVLTSETLQRTGAVKAEDFVKLTPGVTIVTGTAEAGDTQINIRGINGARDAESSVALVVDGILKTNTAQLNQPQGTLSQVEMLKGPQGAIYGRNAAAGAIVMQTLKPTDSLTGAVKASYAQYNTMEASAHIAGPLSEGLGFVLSGYGYKSDGFYRNVLTNKKTVDDKENWAVDGRLVYDRGTGTQLDLKARYAEFSGASLPFNASFHLPNFAAVNPDFYEDVNKHPFNFYNNIRATNDQSSFDISLKLDQELGNSMKLVAWALYSNVKQDLVADGTSADFGRFLGAANPQANGVVTACQASTLALTGYEVNSPGFIGTVPTPFIFDPANGSTFGPYSPSTCDGTQYQVRNQKDFSAEIRLIGDAGDINWQLGAYYLGIKRTVAVSLGGDTGQGVIKQLYNGPTSINPTTLLLADEFDTDVYAGFGAIEYNPSEKFSAGVAVRYDIEDRKSSSLVPTATDPFTGGPINPGQAFGPLADKQARFEQFEPKITLSYRPNSDLNLYANWGIGFKSGGFNNQGSAQLIQNSFVNFFNADVTISDQYDKERSSAFEVGLKGKALGGTITFDLAGYYTRVRDMQFFEFFVGEFGLLRVVSNIDRVDLKGVELSATIKPVTGVKLFGSFNYTDSEIKKNSSRPYTVGNKSPYTADYTLNAGIELEQPLNNNLNAFVRADYRLTGPTWFHTVQDQSIPTIFSGLLPISALALPAAVGDGRYDVAKRNAFGIFNLRGGIQSDNFGLSVFANNLFNKKYLNEVITAVEFGGSFITPGSKRMVGLEGSYKF